MDMASKEQYIVGELPELKKSAANEWIKWLSYSPKKYMDKKNELLSKSDHELSIADLREIAKYSNRERVLPLFKKYYDGKCQVVFFRQILDYIKNNTIEELIFEKLDESDLAEAKLKLSKLNSFSYQQIFNKVKTYEKKENYDKLSMVDSFVFHVASKKCSENNDIKHSQQYIYLSK